MLSLTKLQAHMHQIETQYQGFKDQKSLSQEAIHYFLKGIDAGRQILDQKTVQFDYSLLQLILNPTAGAPSPTLLITKDHITGQREEKVEKRKIFVIDDEEDIISILTSVIEESDFPVSVFGFMSPEEAIHQLPLKKPDVVFTDLKMPQMSGLEVLRHVIAYDPDLPVIFVSGYLSKENMLEALNQGIFGVVEKPFSKVQILSLCYHATQRYQLNKLLQQTMNFIYYHYSDLDSYLKSKGNEAIRSMMEDQFRTLTQMRQQLKRKKHALMPIKMKDSK